MLFVDNLPSAFTCEDNIFFLNKRPLAPFFVTLQSKKNKTYDTTTSHNGDER